MKNIKLSLIFTLILLSACGPQTNKSKTKAVATSVSAISGAQTSIIKTVINETAAEQIDQSTPDCKDGIATGWKCIYATVTTPENLSYKIAVRWNRAGMTSRGTMLHAVGGSGQGDSRQDPPSKAIFDELSQKDQVRTVILEFVDAVEPTNHWGGYFKHFGAYHSAGRAFKAGFDFILDKKIIRGNFLNYLGGSNGTMVLAYAMSNLGLDAYFDRVIFQMGPFLPDLASACDRSSPSSFYINAPETQKSVADLINFWRFGDKSQSVCDNQLPDKVSILKHGNKSFPNTHVHVIVGAMEATAGFGPWILASNLEWYKGISAKSKSRIIRPNMAHNNSYEDMRRYAKLAPDQTVEEDPACKDSRGFFTENSRQTEWLCKGCGQIEAPADDAGGKWSDVGSGCFHRVVAGTAKCSTGTFCNTSKRIIEWSCDCAVTGSEWVDVGSQCFHRETGKSCQ